MIIICCKTKKFFFSKLPLVKVKAVLSKAVSCIFRFNLFPILKQNSYCAPPPLLEKSLVQINPWIILCSTGFESRSRYTEWKDNNRPSHHHLRVKSGRFFLCLCILLISKKQATTRSM
jgi:hypothetical protein